MARQLFFNRNRRGFVGQNPVEGGDGAFQLPVAELGEGGGVGLAQGAVAEGLEDPFFLPGAQGGEEVERLEAVLSEATKKHLEVCITRLEAVVKRSQS